MMQRSPGLTVLFASVLGARNHMLDRGQRSARWSGRPSPAHGPRGPCAHTRDALAPRRLTLDPRPVGMSPRRPLGRAGSCRLSIGRTRAPQPGQAALSAQRVPPGARRCRGRGGAGLGGGPLPLGDWVFPASSRAFEETPEAPVGRTSSASQQPGVPAGLRGQGVQRASGVPRGDTRADSRGPAGVEPALTSTRPTRSPEWAEDAEGAADANEKVPRRAKAIRACRCTPLAPWAAVRGLKAGWSYCRALLSLHLETTQLELTAKGERIAQARPPMGGQVSSPGSFRGPPCASKANADWMSALSSPLWDVPLHQLSIPGSHDTMTYCLNKKSPISSKEPRLLQLLGKMLPCVTLPVVLKWSTTQVLSVTGQLDSGARYLDLRIAHMEDGSERNLHFVHMVYTTALVEDTLTEISEWLEGHPREVVVLACRNFEGMTEGLHEYLVGCIKNIFGDKLCPHGEVPTLRQLWARGQQVILSYEDEPSVRRHAELWPGIPYWWGNKVKPRDLIHYLERMKSCGRPGGLFVAGINLTENLEFILVHPAWSLERLTLWGLPDLCVWVRAQRPGPAAGCTNIIAGDFIGASGFVSDVIALNWKLLRG